MTVLAGTAIEVDAPLYRIDMTESAAHDRLGENIADGIVPSDRRPVRVGGRGGGRTEPA